MISSLSLIITGSAEAAGAVTHYNIAFLKTPYTQGMANTIIIMAADSSDNNITSFTGAVALTCSDPNAILPINATLPVTNGFGSCTIYFGTTGTQTVTVTDTTNNTISGTLTVTVEPIHLTLSVTPTSIVAGESINVTVTALDATDNVLTDLGNQGYGRSLSFSSTDSQAVFPLQGLPSDLVNGVGVFNITLNTVGSQTITVVNKVFPLVNATTTVITVNANTTVTPTASPSPTLTASPTPTVTPTAIPTSAPTITSTPNPTGNSTNTIVIIAIIVVIVVVAVLVAVLFLRKKKISNQDLPPPPPTPSS